MWWITWVMSPSVPKIHKHMAYGDLRSQMGASDRKRILCVNCSCWEETLLVSRERNHSSRKGGWGSAAALVSDAILVQPPRPDWSQHCSEIAERMQMLLRTCFFCSRRGKGLHTLSCFLVNKRGAANFTCAGINNLLWTNTQWGYWGEG